MLHRNGDPLAAGYLSDTDEGLQRHLQVIDTVYKNCGILHCSPLGSAPTNFKIGMDPVLIRRWMFASNHIIVIHLFTIKAAIYSAGIQARVSSTCWACWQFARV